MEWYQWIGIAAIIGGTIGGVRFYRKWDQAVKFMKELGEAFVVTSEAFHKGGPRGRELTDEEAVALAREWMEAIDAGLALAPSFIKKLFGR